MLTASSESFHPRLPQALERGEWLEARSPGYNSSRLAGDVGTEQHRARKKISQAWVRNTSEPPLRRRLSNRRVEESKRISNTLHHGKDAQFRGTFLLRDALRIADAHVRPRRAPPRPTSLLASPCSGRGPASRRDERHRRSTRRGCLHHKTNKRWPTPKQKRAASPSPPCGGARGRLPRG